MVWPFLLALISLVIANIIKVARIDLFIEPYEKPDEKRQTRALALANLLNIFLPFRLGYLARVWYGGKNMKGGRSFLLAAIVAEITIDFICTTIIFAGFSLFGADSYQTIIFYLIVLAVIFILFFATLIFKKQVKHLIYGFASLFNKDIALKVLKFSWFTINSLKDIVRRVGKTRLFLYSVVMWGFNMLSCFFITMILGNSDGNGIYNTVNIFFAEKGITTSTFAQILSSGEVVLLLAYLVSACVLLFLVSFKLNFRYKTHNYINLLPHQNAKDRLDFLKLYFNSEDNGEYFKQYLEINNDVAIIEDYSAGSNATTMLCSKDDKTFYRKYAFSDDAKKLKDQIDWIHSHEKDLTLTSIIDESFDGNSCYYDMPYIPGAVTCFNYVHTEPFDIAWGKIKNALIDLDTNLHQPTLRKSNPELTEQYIEGKVNKNLKKIKNGLFISPLLSFDDLYINGVKYHNLEHFEKMLSKENLEKVFKNDKFADIHGDFTIENIICIKGNKKGKGYYIIDPNTGNLHDSPYLDYAKLLQSLHGGYEFLMNTNSVSVSGNHIDFIFTKSSTYNQLFKAVTEYLEEQFGKDAVRSIFYHEIIHWLRLMPYKIEKNGERSVLFYAGLIMVLNDVEKMFPMRAKVEEKRAKKKGKK